MKRLSLITIAFAAVAVSGWALWVNACDRDVQKNSSAQAGGCPYAHGAAAATAGNCMHGKNAASDASVASWDGTAKSAAQEGCTGKGARGASAGECSMHGKTSAAAAAAGGCPMHGAAATAAAAGDCPMHGSSAAAAECRMHGKSASFAGCGMAGMAVVAASTAGGGMGCGPECGQGATKTAGMSERMDCDACAGRMACEQQLKANGAQTQVVPLGNGVMFVYTTDTPAHVRAVQEAVARRIERLDAMATAGDKVKLCPPCKEIRGAIASGKLTRQTVNVEGGCLTLVTSTDPAIAAKLRAMAGLQNNAAHKS